MLDDLGINLKPARALGMQTLKVTDPDAAADSSASCSPADLEARRPAYGRLMCTEAVVRRLVVAWQRGRSRRANVRALASTTERSAVSREGSCMPVDSACDPVGLRSLGEIRSVDVDVAVGQMDVDRHRWTGRAGRRIDRPVVVEPPSVFSSRPSTSTRRCGRARRR